MVHKKCVNCGVELFSYGNECPLCKSFDIVHLQEEKKDEENNEKKM